jgi:hypothetical protein
MRLLTAWALFAVSAALAPPVMPLSFQVDVELNQTGERPQTFVWSFDYINQVEKKVYTNNQKQTSIYRYRGGDACENNTCCTAYTFGPAMKCVDAMDADTLDKLWPWLTNDTFSHEAATFVSHDAANGCDVWQHNGHPIYPELFSETACVRVAEGNADGAVSTAVPVYNLWVDKEKEDSNTTETHRFSNFKTMATVPAGTFDPPADCPPPSTLLV